MISKLFWTFIGFMLVIPLELIADEVVPTVVIDAQEPASSPLNPYSIYKTERVSKEKFEQANRQSLADRSLIKFDHCRLF